MQDSADLLVQYSTAKAPAAPAASVAAASTIKSHRTARRPASGAKVVSAAAPNSDERLLHVDLAGEIEAFRSRVGLAMAQGGLSFAGSDANDFSSRGSPAAAAAAAPAAHDQQAGAPPLSLVGAEPEPPRTPADDRSDDRLAVLESEFDELEARVGKTARGLRQEAAGAGPPLAAPPAGGADEAAAAGAAAGGAGAAAEGGVEEEGIATQTQAHLALLQRRRVEGRDQREGEERHQLKDLNQLWAEQTERRVEQLEQRLEDAALHTAALVQALMEERGARARLEAHVDGAANEQREYRRQIAEEQAAAQRQIQALQQLLLRTHGAAGAAAASAPVAVAAGSRGQSTAAARQEGQQQQPPPPPQWSQAPPQAPPPLPSPPSSAIVAQWRGGNAASEHPQSADGQWAAGGPWGRAGGGQGGHPHPVDEALEEAQPRPQPPLPSPQAQALPSPQQQAQPSPHAQQAPHAQPSPHAQRLAFDRFDRGGRGDAGAGAVHAALDFDGDGDGGHCSLHSPGAARSGPPPFARPCGGVRVDASGGGVQSVDIFAAQQLHFQQQQGQQTAEATAAAAAAATAAAGGGGEGEWRSPSAASLGLGHPAHAHKAAAALEASPQFVHSLSFVN
jgi:hypothetical protein